MRRLWGSAFETRTSGRFVIISRMMEMCSEQVETDAAACAAQRLGLKGVTDSDQKTHFSASPVINTGLLRTNLVKKWESC